MSNKSFLEAMFGELTLEEIAYDFVRADKTAAVLAVRRGSEEQQVAAIGFAEIDDEIPVQPTDSFRIASVTKPFVAVLFMRLLLSVEDPARNYLPDNLVRDIENIEQASIWQLLNMSSGVYDYLNTRRYKKACDQNPMKQWTALEVLEFVKGRISDFDDVGEDWEYSNTNYVLLQVIAERLMEKPLGKLLDDHIINPLGMMDTYLERYRPGPLINGYRMFLGMHIDETTTTFGTGLADAGLVSTVADLDRFMRGVYAERIISRQSVETLLKPTGKRGNASEYGLGVELLDTEFGLAWGHTGAVPGFTSMMWMLPEHDATVVVLRNVYDTKDSTMSVIDAFDLLIDDD